MEFAFFIAQIIVCTVMIGLVVLQARSAGMSSSQSSSIHRTRRGAEKTIYQATIVLAVVFLTIALIASLPIFNPAPAL